MYRCTICRTVSAPGQPLLRHTIHREVPAQVRGMKPNGLVTLVEGTRKEIARELPVCPACAKRLQGGVSLADLMLVYRPNRFDRPPRGY